MYKVRNALFGLFDNKLDYGSNQPKFEKLRRRAESIVTELLDDSSVICLEVQSRVKTEQSATKKIAIKQYDDPINQMTDLVGLRIIVYLESDIDEVAKILNTAFEIDDANSIDKRVPDKPDVVGYRSLHLVCALGKQRAKNAEYRNICEMKFEVQIRTALTHTWAEIEHKQNYKSAHSLPKRLQRRLNILSGTLELVDLELDQIAKDAGAYKSDLETGKSELDADELSDTVLEVLALMAAKTANVEIATIYAGSNEQLVEDLKYFEVVNVGNLRDFFVKANIPKFENEQLDSIRGFYSLAMCAYDLDKFTNLLVERSTNIYKHRIEKYAFVSGKFTPDQLEKKFTARGIEIIERSENRNGLLNWLDIAHFGSPNS